MATLLQTRTARLVRGVLLGVLLIALVTLWYFPVASAAVRMGLGALIALMILTSAVWTVLITEWIWDRRAKALASPGPHEPSYRKKAIMKGEQAAPETRGVTLKLLAALDLGPEIEGMTGRQLRMRMVTIDPGGVFGPVHDHKDRPGMVYVLQGTITDHRDGVATEYGPGAGWPEDKDTTHWLENRGTTPAVEISVDIVRQP